MACRSDQVASFKRFGSVLGHNEFTREIKDARLKTHDDTIAPAFLKMGGQLADAFVHLVITIDDGKYFKHKFKFN